MDPIEKLKYIISEWKTFIQKQKSYKYHGVYQRCPKDWYYSPIEWYDLLNLTPPEYGIYDNSISWSYGWAFAYLYYRQQYRLYRNEGTLAFQSWGNLERYDTLVMGVHLSGQNCSIQCEIAYKPVQLGVYKDDIPKWNYYVWNSWFGSALGNIGIHWEKAGYLIGPYLIDWWCWKVEPNRYNLNYIVNFKFLPEKNKYLQYDNFGRMIEINNNTTPTIALFNYGMLYMSNYPGISFRYNGITVNSVKFYSDIWK